MVFSIAFISLVLLLSHFGGSWALAVYALSYWHYYLYWLAYRYGAIPIAEFKNEAIALKTVAILALGSVYLAAPLDPLSLTVVAAGFLLNTLAARALGSDRTYYGYELTDLPHRAVTAFPYSLTSHPMLLGNIAAFGGTLLNAGFREQWWPLAVIHVAMNVGLLIMELAVTPQRRSTQSARGGKPVQPLLAGALTAATGAALCGTWAVTEYRGIAAALGAAAGIYLSVTYLRYSRPATTVKLRRATPQEDSL